MKRYVRSSIDSSAPAWLKKSLTAKYGNFRSNLLKKFNVALDRANFLDYEPSGRSLPIYLLQTDFGNEIYAPGVNDDSTVMINNRNRKLGSIAKSKLPDIAVDSVWIDLDDNSNFFEKKERYQDPRYTYRYNSRGDYAGQYKKAPYLGNGEYGPETWSESGKLPSNERGARDKSGYKVPSPEQKIAEYYKKFPERVTNKVDDVYDRIIEVRQELMDIDINRNPKEYGEDYFRRAYSYLSDAIYYYRQLLNSLDENRMLKGRFWDGEYSFRDFSKTLSTIKDYLDDIEKMIEKM